MSTASHGEYGAFTNKNSVRYQKDNKLIAQSSVPPEVVNYLNKQLGYKPKGFPMPSEEEKARMRAESLIVKPELQRVDELPLTQDDFIPSEEPTEVPHAPEPGEIMPTVVAEPVALPTEPDPMSEFMESVSIHTASLEDMVNAMSERFGIYSVYLNRLPQGDEINPLTGEAFTKYHLGIAYQAAIRAQSIGVLNIVPESNRRTIDANRDASANFQVDPVPQTMGQARRANSFDYRTSVQGSDAIATTEIVHEVQPDGSVRAVQRPITNPHGVGTNNGAQSRYDAQEDEQLVVPNFSGKPIVRANW